MLDALKLLEIDEKSNKLSDLLKNSYELFESTVVAIDENYRLLAHFSPNNVKLGPTYLKSIEDGFWSLELINKINSSLKESKNMRAFVTFDSVERLFIKLESNGKEIGYLVFIENGKSLKNFDEDTLNHFIKLVIKHIKIENSSTRNKNMKSLFEALLNDEILSEDIFIDRYKRINFDKKISYQMLIIDMSIIDSKYFKSIEVNLPNCFKNMISIYKDNYLVCFISSSYDKEKLDSFFFENKIYGLISKPILSLFTIPTLFTIQKKLLKFLISASNEYILYDESDYCTLSSIVAIDNNLVLLSFIHEDIIKLLKYDLKNNDSLCKTLYYYLANFKSLKETSKDVFLHKNTITYRLDKIKEIIEDDLSNSKKDNNYYISLEIVGYLLDKKFDFKKYIFK